MSTPEGDELNRLNLKVAEACGWYDFGSTAPQRGSLEPRIIGRNKERMDRRAIPDFATSLDAAAELRKGLTEEEAGRYVTELLNLTTSQESTVIDDWLAVINATAAQHARAFLAAKGVA